MGSTVQLAAAMLCMVTLMVSAPRLLPPPPPSPTGTMLAACLLARSSKAGWRAMTAAFLASASAPESESSVFFVSEEGEERAIVISLATRRTYI